METYKSVNVGDRVTFLALEVGVRSGEIVVFSGRRRYHGTVCSFRVGTRSEGAKGVVFVSIKPDPECVFDGTRNGARVDKDGLREVMFAYAKVTLCRCEHS